MYFDRKFKLCDVWGEPTVEFTVTEVDWLNGYIELTEKDLEEMLKAIREAKEESKDEFRD